jgi:hypothetical protein
MGERIHFDPAEAFLSGAASVGLVGEEQRELYIFDGGEGVEELERLKDEADLLAAKAGEFGVGEGGGGLAVDEDFAGGREIHCAA